MKNSKSKKAPSLSGNKEKFVQFGYHLTIDLYECPKAPLEDLQLCYDVLNTLPEKLEMHKLIPPYLIPAGSNLDAGGKDPGGITGMVIIAESHISIHTFAKRGFVSIDVYSCKPFNQKLAVKHFEDAFKPKESEVHFLNRGEKYPTDDIHD
jgi:S-adenosylmethionine decarboxylase